MPRLPSRPIIYEINTIAWLSGLSRRAGVPVTLATVPDAEWEAIAALGAHAVWLMGVWERSPAGLAVALAHAGLQQEFRRALPDLTPDDIAASPYCVRRYVADGRFGGFAGLAIARKQLASRGVGLVLDFVPNHLARDHPWVETHPERFIHGTPADLARDPDAFFQAGPHVIACGKDPYFPPWSDVAQVNAFSPGLRMGTVDALRDIASQCDGVRCDMAMLLMTDVFARTWGDRAGTAPGDDFWPGVISRVLAQAPHFTFIAEAYWIASGRCSSRAFITATTSGCTTGWRTGTPQACGITFAQTGRTRRECCGSSRITMSRVRPPSSDGSARERLRRSLPQCPARCSCIRDSSRGAPCGLPYI